MRTNNIFTCIRCLDLCRCLLEHVRPVLGLCSFIGRDVRRMTLEAIGRRVSEGNGTASLRSAVTVDEDDVAGPVSRTVRRVSRFPGAPEGTLCFDVGDGTSTDCLSTEDLVRILGNC